MTVENKTREAHPHFGRTVPLMSLLGVQAVSLDENGAVTRLPWRADLTNSLGHIHGGTLMSVLDFTMSAAGRSHDAGLGMATIDMVTHFIAPGQGDLTIKSHVLRRGSSIIFCEGEIRDEKGTLVAKASASFKPLSKRVGGDS